MGLGRGRNVDWFLFFEEWNGVVHVVSTLILWNACK